MLNLIDPSRQADVLTAIQTAFNTEQITAISLLHGGGSASLIYKIAINKQYYVLRLMSFEQPLADRTIQIDCFTKAAQLNIAPSCYYANAENGIIIMGYIPHQPITERLQFLTELGNLINRLHTTIDFAPAFITTFDYLTELTADLNQHALPAFLIEYINIINEIKNLLTPNLIKTACNNDLNFQNILFDGRKIWLIDWEATGCEDLYFDLAAVCNQLTFNNEMEKAFLRSYFGKALDAYQQAKLLLIQQVAHYYYAVHFLNYAAKADKVINDFATPDLFTWNVGFSTGTYKLNTPDDFLLYGLVQAKTSLSKIKTKKFLMAKVTIGNQNNA